MNTSVSISDFSQRSPLRATLVWGLAAFFYFYELMLLVSTSVMLDDLSLAFTANAEQLGSVAAYYYYAYAIMQIPVGLLMDRFGPKILLTCAALLCVLGCVIFGMAPVLWVAKLGRFVMGVGGSFAVVGCLKLSFLWFPTNRFALLTGLMVAVGMMGAAFGQEPVALLVMAVGWRQAAFIGAGIGFLSAVAIWCVVRDQPHTSMTLFSKTQTVRFFSGLYLIMKDPQAWIVSLYAGLMFVPTTGFGQLWGVPYFIERYQIDKPAAGLMVSMIFFGWAVGGPLYGWLSDKMGRRRLPMGFAALSTLCVISAIMYLPLSALQMKIAMFLLGLFSSGFIIAFSLVREINAPLLTGTAIGFVNTLNNASGALAQPIVGKLLDAQLEASGHANYTLPMYNEAFLFLPACILLAFLTIPFIRETFCRQRQAP